MKSDSISAQARQYQRHKAEFPVRIETHPDHADQFRLSYPDVQSGMAVIDVSVGGVGLRSGIFLPKNLRLSLIVSGVGSDQGECGCVWTIPAVVRRVQMIDHRPTYQVGLQFVDSNGLDEQALIQAGTLMRVEQDQLSAVGGNGGA